MLGFWGNAFRVVTALALVACYTHSAEAEPFSVDQFPQGYIKKDPDTKDLGRSKAKAPKVAPTASPTDWGGRWTEKAETTKAPIVTKARKETPTKEVKTRKRKPKAKPNQAAIAKAMDEVIDNLKATRAAQDQEATEDSALSQRIKKFSGKSPKALPRPDQHLNSSTNKSAISLVVAAEPESHFQSAIESLGRLHDQHAIPVSQIQVVHGNFSPGTIFSSLVKTPEIAEIMHKLTSSGTSIQPTGAIPKTLKVKSSPVWLVYHEGKTHIFEGYSYPQELFDAHGEFIGANINVQRK
jgi:hypothetical protein